MLIIGAKGFAKEVLEVCYQLQQVDNLVFFDDINSDAPDELYGAFPVLKTVQAVMHYFKTVDTDFTIGIGNPMLRKKLADKFKAMGGTYTSTISPLANVGNFGNIIGEGTNILSGAIVSNDVTIGKGCIIYFNSIITHDCVIEDFVEISPSVTLLGKCKIKKYTQIGSNATILPKVTIGKNVIIGAGAVITTSIPDNSVAVGIPAKVIKTLPPLDFS